MNMKKFFCFFCLLIFSLFAGCQLTQASPLIPEKKIENIRIDNNLKENPDVHLNHLTFVSSRLYTIIDDDKNYYFCLNEESTYPEVFINYIFDEYNIHNGAVV